MTMLLTKEYLSDKDTETKYVGSLSEADRKELNNFGLDIPSTAPDSKVKIEYEDWQGERYVEIHTDQGWSDHWRKGSDGIDWARIESKLDEMEEKSGNKRTFLKNPR